MMQRSTLAMTFTPAHCGPTLDPSSSISCSIVFAASSRKFWRVGRRNPARQRH
eukprot:CAMPEP_0115359972 /NCGR_PEP_ID=MMETSP0270-20121206/101446_1 /TAXON_ID=71861 /ORGANISM="Scrippsiella trochoidea, Strain CCMP3099" /LENGTH=52 /DNA_ID=CAMNT_0002782491 /DNA_START=136 /DNA_END=291 /DNA_ORIENTATION=+